MRQTIFMQQHALVSFKYENKCDRTTCIVEGLESSRYDLRLTSRAVIQHQADNNRLDGIISGI